MTHSLKHDPGYFIVFRSAKAISDAQAHLRAQWFCLHLPRTQFDLRRGAEARVRLHLPFEQRHRIGLVRYPDDFEGRRLVSPTLFLCPDDLLEATQALSVSNGAPLPPVPFSRLDDAMLATVWESLRQLDDHPQPNGLAAPPLVEADTGAPATLAWHFLARQLDDPPTLSAPDGGDASAWLESLLACHDALDAGPRPVAVASEDGRTQQPIWSALGIRQPYAEVERSARLFMLSHNVLKDNALPLQLTPTPAALFEDLAAIEAECAGAEPDTGRIWTLIERIGSRAGDLFSALDLRAMSRASSACFFSSFPLGLARLPGSSSPLQCSLPTWYLPTAPLAAAIEHELSAVPMVLMRAGFHALYAECIHRDDPAHPDAVHLRQYAEHLLGGIAGVRFEYLDIQSEAELAVALGERPALDVLILSAHGEIDAAKGLAGIDIAGQFSLGLGWPRVPPIVILVSCSAAPRGDNLTTIAEVLLYRGAVAVVATLAAVDVRRSIDIVARLFACIATAIDGRSANRTLADVWRAVQQTCVVNDIVAATPELSAWAARRWDAIVDAFDAACESGHITTLHLHRGTESLLATLAERDGLSPDALAVIRERRYIAETLLYVLMGRPQRIICRDPALESSRQSAGVFDLLGRPVG